MTVSNEMKGSMKIIDIAMMTQDAIFAESHLDSLILQLKENFIINKSRDYSYQFTTEQWTFNKRWNKTLQNPNEQWFQRTAFYIAQIIAQEKGGVVNVIK